MKPPSLTRRFRYSFLLNHKKSTHTIECIKHNNCICMYSRERESLGRVNKFHFSWKLHRIIIIVKKWSGSYRQNRYTQKKVANNALWMKIFRSWANYCSIFTSRTVFWGKKETTRQNEEEKKFSCDPQCVIYAKDSMHVSNKCVSKALPRLTVFKKCKWYSFVNAHTHCNDREVKSTEKNVVKISNEDFS